MPDLPVVQLTLQALSSLAIAGGLLYTAVQFRRARKAQLVANFSKLVELQYQLRQLRVQHPELASPEERATLPSPQDVQRYYLDLMQLSLYEIAWYAHEHGELPEDYFQSWTRRIWDEAHEESFRRMIESPAMKIMHDQFDLYVRRLIKSPAPPPSAARD